MIDLPARRGPRPSTTATNPHSQVDQQPTDAGIREALALRAFALRNVTEQPSGISVPGARALCLDPALAAGSSGAFMVGTEFAHLHPSPDMSLHLMLPEVLARRVTASGWGELHIAARAGLIPSTAMMIYAPRDNEELEIAYELVVSSYRFARGDFPASA
ncbi:MAG: luciferase family protein [Actinomycetota bacterium]